MINLEDFLKKSVSLIDSADINREISKCNYQFSKELLNKDLKIAQMDTKIQSIKRTNKEAAEKNNTLKDKLNQMLDSIS